MVVFQRVELHCFHEAILPYHRSFDGIQEGFVEVVDTQYGRNAIAMIGQCTQHALNVLFGVTNRDQMVQKQKNGTFGRAQDPANSVHHGRFSVLRDLP